MRPSLQRTPMGFGTEPTEVARTPSSTLVVLNSRDRFANATPGQSRIVTQPWNDFTLQKPQALLDAFARRIQVTEIRFPWYIPNIQEDNRFFYIFIDGVEDPLLVFITPGFYTPSALVTAINEAIGDVAASSGVPAGDVPVLTQSNNQFVFTQQEGGPNFALGQPSSFPTLANPNPPSVTPYAYLNTPNLLNTIGVPPDLVVFDFAGAINYQPLIAGNYTTLLYTDFVDIVSKKLNYYANVKDGGSGISTQSSLICRLYAADEVSIAADAPIGTSPFTIHRQFKTPKSIRWDPNSFLDWIDVQVYDQYGKLIPLPSIGTGAYPDFQITLLASED